MTKHSIGKGHESGSFCTLDMQFPKPVACIRTVTPFEAHCRFGRPSLVNLEKLCQQFSKLSSLDCESCEFAKHHHLSSSPQVDKRASAPFVLVHYDVWIPCHTATKPGFHYFVLFMIIFV